MSNFRKEQSQQDMARKEQVAKEFLANLTINFDHEVVQNYLNLKPEVGTLTEVPDDAWVLPTTDLFSEGAQSFPSDYQEYQFVDEEGEADPHVFIARAHNYVIVEKTSQLTIPSSQGTEKKFVLRRVFIEAAKASSLIVDSLALAPIQKALAHRPVKIKELADKPAYTMTLVNLSNLSFSMRLRLEHINAVAAAMSEDKYLLRQAFFENKGLVFSSQIKAEKPVLIEILMNGTVSFRPKYFSYDHRLSAQQTIDRLENDVLERLQHSKVW